ncbi:MAG: GWxTD domain-containing protein [Gemmatimonadales bacterium]
MTALPKSTSLAPIVFRVAHRATVLAVVAVILGGGPVSAQSPEQRAELVLFRDSIWAIQDTVQLLDMERRMIEVAKVDRDNTLLHLKLGFVSLQIGDLGSKQHYDDAASEFQWATELEPNWPYAWFGLGLAEQGVGDSQISIIRGIKNMLGKDALTRSAMAFARSAQVDPAFDQGLVHLAETALEQRINIKLDLALEAMRVADTTPAGQSPLVQLYRGRVERAAGDLQYSEDAFQKYVAMDHNRSLGLLELSRTRFLLGMLDARGQYLAGAATDDSTTISEYRFGLSYIASEDEIHAFDMTDRDTRPAYLADYWEAKDRYALRRDGERLREHVRRIYYARQNFYLITTNRYYDISEIYRSDQDLFDDRGVIYIRHGEPTDRASYHGIGVFDNESWRYAQPDGDMIFHFIAREDVQDYKLVESVFDIMGYSQAVVLQGTGTQNSVLANELLDSRDRLSPLYRRIQGAGSGSTGRLQAEERTLGRTSIELGTTTDSYELEFPLDLPARTQVLAVGYRGNLGMVHVTFAIPGSALTGVENPRGIIYPVRLRFVGMNADGKLVGSIDTTRVFLARRAVPANEYLVGEVNVPVPSGMLTYRMAVQQGEDVGTVMAIDSVFVAPVAGGTLGLSDPVLGSRSTNLIWRPAPGDSVFFNPHGRYRQDDLVELYYEVYGLRPGSTYETQLVVKKRGGGGGFLGLGKIFGGGSTPISLRFEEQAVDQVVRIQRAIQLKKLKPGSYTLQLIVTSEDGTTQRREQDFEVVKPR